MSKPILRRKPDRESRDAQRVETKFAAVIAITQPVHAATAVLHGIKQYLQATSHNDQVRWTTATNKAVDQLDDTLNHFSLKEIANGLRVDDRLNYLMTLSRLSTDSDTLSQAARRIGHKGNLSNVGRPT